MQNIVEIRPSVLELRPGQTDGETDGRRDGRTDGRYSYISPQTSFGGIMKKAYVSPIKVCMAEKEVSINIKLSSLKESQIKFMLDDISFN